MLLILGLGSCALPAPEYEDQIFIPQKEVLAATLFQDGVRLYQAGRYMDAELSFRQVEYLYPNSENTAVNLALCLRGVGDYPAAISMLQEVIKREPKAFEYQFFLAETYFQAGQFEQAIRAYQELILSLQEQNENANVQIAERTLAAILFRLGRESEALCYSSMAFERAATPAETLRHARLLVATGDANRAINVIERVFDAFPDLEDSALWKELSLAQIGAGRIEEAAKYFDLASSKAGTSPDSELVAIGSYLEQGGVVGARRQGLQAALGTSLEVEEEDQEGEAEIVREILQTYNSLIFLYWPVPLVDHVEEIRGTESGR